MRQLVVSLVVLSACGAGTFGTGRQVSGFSPNGTGQCESQAWWSAGNRESATMNPGLACRACHLQEGEGPRDFFMGTAYPTLNEVDLCMSADVPADAVVEILDLSDVVRLTLPINQVGNFSSTDRDSPVSPYKARVRANGKVMAMGSAQTDGDCNVCHTATGANGAPGRVLIPR